MALDKVLRRLGAKKVKEMDEAAKKGMFGQPEKAAKKEKGGKLTEKEKAEMQASLREGGKRPGKEALTPAEEEAQDRIVRKRIRESAAERAEGMSKADKPRSLSKKEQEREQAALRGMKKGGMVKNYAKGGMVKCGASNPPSGGSRNK
jgi:hypothetical protein